MFRHIGEEENAHSLNYREDWPIGKKDLKKLSRNDRKLLEETMDVEKEYSDDVNSLNNDSK